MIFVQIFQMICDIQLLTQSENFIFILWFILFYI